MAKRRQEPDVFENENRKSLYEMIRGNPGMPYQKLRNTSGIGTNILVHHLDVLVKKGYVFTRGEGREREYFPVKKGKSKGLNQKAKDIIRYVGKHQNGIEHKEAAAGLRMKRSVLKQFAEELEQEGYLEIDEQGSFVFYYPKA